MIVLTCYVLGGYATTDILRLLKGSKISVIDNSCYCQNCNVEIPWYRQIPILSYFLNRGKCFKCGKSIPKISVFLEIGIFLLLTFVAIILKFSSFVFLVLFLLYELIKLIMIIIYKKRENGFTKEYSVSITLNILYFGFMYFLYFIVDKIFFFLAFL